MKSKLFYMLFVAILLLMHVPLWAQDDAAQSQDDTAEAQALAPIEDSDEDWLNTMWTQVDDMVKEEEFKLQKTVTVAGVRGAEAEDNILTKLYYKGGKRYPSQEKLTKAIDTLKKALAKNPKATKLAARQKFFIAQCYEKLGKTGEARNYYSQIAKNHPQTSYAAKAQNKLSQLSTTNSP